MLPASVASILLLVLILSSHAPNGVLCVHFLHYPKDVAIPEGQTLELNCVVEDREPWERLYWAFRWDAGDGLWRYIHIADDDLAHDNIIADIGRSHFVYRGTYSLRSEVAETTKSRDGVAGTQRIENYTLSIVNARRQDSGTYMCLYKPKCLAGEIGVDAVAARVTVLELADATGSRLTCYSYLTYESPISTRDAGTRVFLTCHAKTTRDTDVSRLLWFREGRLLGEGKEFQDDSPFSYEYTLQPDDNGRRFDCVLVEANEKLASCSVVPLVLPPVLSLTPARQEVYEGADAVFTCVSSGLPYIETFVWYVGDTRIFIRDAGTNFLVENGNCTSTLRVKQVKASDTERVVVCVAAVPSGVSANASAGLVVRRADHLQTVLHPEGETSVLHSTSAFFTCSVLPSDLAAIASYRWFVDESILSISENLHPPENDSLPEVKENSGPKFDIMDAGSAGSILHIKELEYSDLPFNITCKAVLPNLRSDYKSCLVSVQNGTGGSSSAFTVALAVGTGGGCFVLGLLLALLLFMLYPRCVNTVAISTPVEDTRKGSTEIEMLSVQQKGCRDEHISSEVGPGLESSPLKVLRKDIQLIHNRHPEITHTYARGIGQFDSDEARQLEMEENPLISAYAEIPEPLLSIRPATLPRRAHNTPATEDGCRRQAVAVRADALESPQSSGGAKGDLSSGKLPKWPPTKTDEVGTYEMPSGSRSQRDIQL